MLWTLTRMVWLLFAKIKRYHFMLALSFLTNRDKMDMILSNSVSSLKKEPQLVRLRVKN